jgi:amidophosphoribosyltransferase
MCGIAGVYINKNFDGRMDYGYLREHFSRLLVSAEIRGTHATGAFILRKGSASIEKSPQAASQFVRTEGYMSFLDKLDSKATALVGHTRFATQGDPSDNNNNHPIVDKPIVAVHNGIIRNDEVLDAKYTSVAEVDSASAVAAIRHYAQKDRLTTAGIRTALKEVEGVYTLLIGDIRTGRLFATRNTNPLVFHEDRKHGLLWFASTEAILESVFPLTAKQTQPILYPYSAVRFTSENGIANLSKATALSRPKAKYEPSVFSKDVYIPAKYRLFRFEDDDE